MKIYDKNDIVLLDVEVNDNSFRYRSIMQGDSVTLYYSLTEHIEIPVGSYITLPGDMRYTLCKPENFNKKGTRNFEYTVVFDGEQELLKRYKYKFITKGLKKEASGEYVKTYQLKFPLTARPEVFLQLLVDNLNLYLPDNTNEKYKWKVGDFVKATEKALSFNHEYCYDVLNRLAGEFNTEWEVEGRTIHLRKVEKNKDNPLPLSYGKGNGFKTGIGRQTQGDKPPVTRLYVQGGERNIYLPEYGSKTLLLPLDKELSYEKRRYKTDPEGTYIYRIDKIATDINEDSLDASHIYPSWTGTISEVVEIDKEKHIYKFKIYDPEKQPDFTNSRMPDEKATIIFQSGLLTGLEFDLTQTSETITGYIHKEGLFQIEKLETGGLMLPNDSLKMMPGDEFAVFHIKLPQEYICDDENKKGGSWDMFREAVRYMHEHEEEQFSFTGELDGIWAKKNWLNIGGKITPGGYVEFSDTQFQPEGIPIRITGVKDYINNPHSPEVELSNIPIGGFVSNDLGKIDSNEVVVENNHKEVIQYTKRRWRDAKETLSMLEEAIEGFSAGITPVWVQTMSMLVGDESLQFRFVRQTDRTSSIDPSFLYNQSNNEFSISAVAPFSLQHMTLGINYSSPSHALNEYRFWNMSPYKTAPLDNEPALYLYAVCSKSTGNGYFSFFREAKKMDGNTDYYFLVGVLSSDYEGERSFTTLYGFTEILPGRITTKLLKSENGNTYFDLEKGEIGGKIVFKSGSSGYNNLNDKPDLSGIDKAINLAGQKAEVFRSTPYPPYTAGDLWVNSTKEGGKDIFVCAASRLTGNYNPNDWARSSNYDSTQVVVDAGYVTGGGIKVIGTAGTVVAGITGAGIDQGSIRIWAGGTYQNRATANFRVNQEGAVYSNKAFYVQDANGEVNAGFQSFGTDKTSIRMWAGNKTPASAPFQVKHDGSMQATKGQFGGFEINGYTGLTWKGYDYFGGTEYSLVVGTNKMPVSQNIGSIIYAGSTTVNPSCCIAGVVSGAGVGIYGSSDGWGSNFPPMYTKYAAFFSGNTKTTGVTESSALASSEYRYITNRLSNGGYEYLTGVSFNPSDYDLDKVRFTVRGGLIVGVTKE